MPIALDFIQEQYSPSVVGFPDTCPDVDEDVIESLEMLYSGALVRAGMGFTSYDDVAERLEKSARLMLR